MLELPNDLITHYYYKIVKLTKLNTTEEFIEAIKFYYYNYYESKLNYETLYENILNLSILYFIITSQNCKYYYDLYGDYLFNELINKENFNNELLHVLFNKTKKYIIINLNITYQELVNGCNKQVYINDNKEEILNINIPVNSKNHNIISINDNIKIILNLISTNNFIIINSNIFYNFKISIETIVKESQVSFQDYFGKIIYIETNNIKINSINLITGNGYKNNKTNFYYIISIDENLLMKNNSEICKNISVISLNTIIKLIIENKKLNYNEIIEILNLLNSNDFKEELLIENIREIEFEVINIENEIISRDIYKKYKNHFINQLIFKLFEMKE